MRKRLTTLTAAVAALVALAVGGSAIASATQNAPSTKPPAQVEQKADAQNGATEPKTGVDNDAIEQENGADDATEPAESAESEAAEGPETERAEAAENEQEVPGDDGPGGHADEPGNPNADHQFEGEE